MMWRRPSSHSQVVLAGWDSLSQTICDETKQVVVDGESLRLSKVVAVARYGTSMILSKEVIPRVQASSGYLAKCLARGDCIYGVNTGFGGSADTRTDDTYGLQRSLVETLQYGIIDLQGPPQRSTPNNSAWVSIFARALPTTDPPSSTCMPESWVRASMLVRASSLASGNSGVRPDLICCISDLLQKDIIPIIPLRGSISASGDLSPLSYIAGAVQGSPGIKVRTNNPDTGHRKTCTAKSALKAHSISPVHLGPKEGLAIVNGTAVSAGVAGLALHDAHCLAVLSQILTAMGVEALCGTDESFAPFIATVRPHPGQVEAARNISSFLKGSKLTVSHPTNGRDSVDDGSLRQDRYSIRTSSQWLGPGLEDLLLAHEQLSTEINSTTDNPLIDPVGEHIYHGGNFQAMAVTSAMEKTRRCLQIMGRMLFAQCTELINPALNNGLPPNLTADEPSKSFLMKGVDIGIAALQAELGFLSGSVVSHVQTAEMNNQSLNSLALISARYTHTALDVLFQLTSYYLFALCQALDLRALQERFLKSLRPEFEALVDRMLGSLAVEDAEGLKMEMWPRFQKELSMRTKLDSTHRFREAVSASQPLLLEHIYKTTSSNITTLTALKEWTQRATSLATITFNINRTTYAANPDATPVLGPASSRMYNFIRHDLAIPFIHGDGEYNPPTAGAAVITKEGESVLDDGENILKGGDPSKGHSSEDDNATVGTLVTKIYTSLRDGSGFVPVMECLREALAAEHLGEGEGGGGKVKAKL